jgi:membrane protein required for beta-lactamase induction
MNFLALLLGLFVERALTHLFHLREFRWLDPLFDFALRRAAGWSRAPAALALGVFALVLVAPVAWAAAALAGRLGDVPAFAFAVLVLLFSLGPRDLQEEADEYRAAADAGREDDLRRLARELAERDVPGDAATLDRAVERAICVQAVNRVFGVVFWFLVLGPAGAWLFRVTDLMRRRAAFAPPPGAAGDAARALQGLLAWLPARLMAAGFALAGSFDGARAAWRAEPAPPAATLAERTEDLVERVGRGASAGSPPDVEHPAAAGSSAVMALARRTLWLIWYPVIAVLTLNDVLR